MQLISTSLIWNNFYMWIFNEINGKKSLLICTMIGLTVGWFLSDLYRPYMTVKGSETCKMSRKWFRNPFVCPQILSNFKAILFFEPLRLQIYIDTVFCSWWTDKRLTLCQCGVLCSVLERLNSRWRELDKCRSS